MKTAEIMIKNQNDYQRVLEVTEAQGEESGLKIKEKLRLRLLAEEMMGFLYSLSGEADGLFWIETQGNKFFLHLKSEVLMNREIREQLLATATSGKNSAAKGFMGKLREMIVSAMIPSAQSPVMSGLSLGLVSSGSPIDGNMGMDSYVWSLNNYKKKVSEDGMEEDEAVDLERSIVANLADEVIVKIVGSKVELEISKTF